MPGHRAHQPLNRGFTLIELAVGVAVLGTLVLLIAGLFRAGAVTSEYTLRHTFALANARKSFQGEGSRRGLVWGAQNARKVRALSAGALSTKDAANDDVDYTLSKGKILRSQLGTQRSLSEGIESVEFKYYNLADDGTVIESTAPESAAMVTAMISIKGSRGNTYRFLSGAALRNRP
ncbi:MAG: prepilin-type N-terminal cleavage/methylation domain-containing protein [Elusimicrobiota bacterium]